MRTILISLGALALAACGASGESPADRTKQAAEAASAAEGAEPPRDLLSLAEGAVLVSATANPQGALSLTDGDPETRWSNGGPRYPGPFTFVFELRAPTRLAHVGIDNSGPRPGGVAGASARTIAVEASAESAEAGFAQIGAIEAAADGETLIDVAASAPVRWLRFTVSANQGDAAWTYFDEVIAYGEQAAPASGERFTGVFAVGPRAFVELKQQGATLSGCYVEQAGHANGAISGDVVDGVARIQWRRTDGPDVSGVALLVVDSRGHLNGVRYRDRSRIVWSGPPAPEGTTTPCSEAPPPANPIADALAAEGEVRIYGILFDFDSATLKAQSEPVLQQLRAALQANPQMRVAIEGHTDNVGEDAYNLSLSQRRAQSVVTWLTEHGVAAGRLTPEGKGEAEPVASNDAADGRALNRRVEVRRL